MLNNRYFIPTGETNKYFNKLRERNSFVSRMIKVALEGTKYEHLVNKELYTELRNKQRMDNESTTNTRSRSGMDQLRQMHEQQNSEEETSDPDDSEQETSDPEDSDPETSSCDSDQDQDEDIDEEDDSDQD